MDNVPSTLSEVILGTFESDTSETDLSEDICATLNGIKDNNNIICYSLYRTNFGTFVRSVFDDEPYLISTDSKSDDGIYKFKSVLRDRLGIDVIFGHVEVKDTLEEAVKAEIESGYVIGSLPEALCNEKNRVF